MNNNNENRTRQKAVPDQIPSTVAAQVANQPALHSTAVSSVSSDRLFLFGRRTFLLSSLGTTLLSAFPRLVSAQRSIGEGRIFVQSRAIAAVGNNSASFSARFLRTEDRLDLTVEFHNLRFQKGPLGALWHRLVKIDPDLEAHVVFVFSPQHLAEISAVISGAGTGTVPEIGRLSTEAAAASRVAFRLPKSLFPLPLSLKHLLEWSLFEPVANVVESRKTTSDPSEVGPLTTVINLFRMSLVPVRFLIDPKKKYPALRWLLPQPPAEGKANLIFHARLIDRDLRADPDISSGVGLAVAHATDDSGPVPPPEKCPNPQGFLWPISPKDRRYLRWLSFVRWPGNAARSGERAPEPILGSTVVLSSPGGHFLLDGAWDLDPRVVLPNEPLDLVKYHHEISQGRDSDVTIAYEYFLYPSMHRVLLIKQTQRKLVEVTRAFDKQRTHAARLETRFFLVVKDDELAYTESVQPFPFRRIRIPKEFWTSPPLQVSPPTPDNGCDCDDFCPVLPVRRSSPGEPPRNVFRPTVKDGVPFEYEFIGTDYAGDDTRFKLAPILISAAFVGLDDRTSDARREFPDPRFGGGISHVRGAQVSLGRSFSNGDTRLDLTALCFTSKPKKTKPAAAAISSEEHPAPFFPTVQWVAGRFRSTVLPNATYSGPAEYDSAAQFRLCNPDDGQFHHPEKQDVTWKVSKPDGFQLQLTESPFDEKSAQAAELKKRSIFAIVDRPKSDSEPIKTQYHGGSAGSGGFVAPDIIVDAASREIGATALPASILAAPDPARIAAQSKFTKDLFPLDAKVAGIELAKIVAPILFKDAGRPPSFISTSIGTADGPDYIEAKLDWSLEQRKGQIQPFPRSGDYPIFDPKDGCTLTLKASLTAWLIATREPQIQISASLTNFDVNIGWGSFNGVQIPFKRIWYGSYNGQKPEVQVDIGEIKFVGPILEFIDQIRTRLKDLTQSKDGWRIAYENNGLVIDAPPVKLPIQQLGAFSVENLAIYSGCYVPFTGGAGVTFRFSLAKPDARFRATAGIYAGGGYALLELDTDRIRRFELCLEFGAAKSLSLGPVHGDVGVMGGVIYQALSNVVQIGTGADAFDAPRTQVTLVAYVRAFGTFSAWSLISVFLEIYVEMRAAEGGEVAGTARFTVGAKVGFVSYSYTASHKETLSRGKAPGVLTNTSTLTAAEVADPGRLSSEIHTDELYIDIAELEEFLGAYTD